MNVSNAEPAWVGSRGARVWRVVAAALLLGIGANPAAAQSTSSTQANMAVHDALRRQDIGYLKDLLVNGDPALVETTVGRGGTPLHVAASLNLAEAAELLLQHGARVDSRTDGGFTPLHWAASRNAAEVAAVLIAHGADVDAESATGIRPIHWAAHRNATRVVELLIAAGAALEAETASGARPIHWAYMGKSEDAAMLIADRIVTLNMESEATNVVVEAEEPPSSATEAAAALPDDSEEALLAQLEALLPASRPAPAPPAAEMSPSAPAAAPAAEATDIYITRDGASMGKSLIVAIGLGETLVFEWNPSLQVWAGKYEVTNGQFRRYRPSHASGSREKLSLDGNDQPAVYVSWHDAQDYCIWLNRTYRDRLPRDFVFRLPYAVEWTLLARCGEKRKYPWGNDWPPAYGNFSDLTAREQLASWNGISGYVDGYAVSCPVVQSGMNEWGLYGMGGNVWEWCQDDYPQDRRYKLRRGGSWDFDPEPSLRLSTLGFDRPEVRDDTIGFRIVASMPPGGNNRK